MKDLQHLAFDMAEKSQHPHPFNRDKKLAGRDWVKAFLDRHGLNLRQPQATDIAHSVGFNKPQVQKFFGLYRELLDTHEYTSARVWNMDETGISTVQKPGKVIVLKGGKRSW